MKKISVIILSLLVCFSLVISGFAEEISINLNSTELTVTVENGVDAGYITGNGNLYSATAYMGNKFLGWYKDGELISDNAIYNFSGVTGNVVTPGV